MSRQTHPPYDGLVRGSVLARVSAFLGAILLALLLSPSLMAQGEPPIPPKPARHFTDNTGLVDAATVQRLDQRLVAFERQSSIQFLVVFEPKLPEGTWLEDYTVKTAQAWGVGKDKEDNGVVLFVFTGDRKMRIEVGYGLEGRLPDSVCATIIRNELRPAFQRQAYGEGADRAITAIIAATKGEYQGTGKTLHDQKAKSGSWVKWLVIALFILFIVWGNSGDAQFRGNGANVVWTAMNILEMIARSGGSGGGGGGGGGDSGGFSGGGGDFGGGGASGDW